MGRFIYLEKDLAENTTYKSIKSAYDQGNLTIVYFPRDNAYYFQKAEIPAKTIDLVKKELERMYPGIRYMEG